MQNDGGVSETETSQQETTRPLDTSDVQLAVVASSPESESLGEEESEEKMEGFASEAAYQTFDKSIDDDDQPATTNQDVPNRYKTRSKNSEEKSRARAEARRTRRTMRMEQQQQKRLEEQQQKKVADPHYKISYSSDSSEDSSVNEDYEVESIAESEIESLTWRGRMQHALHHQLFHILIVSLVSLDALIVIFELLIDVGAFGNVRCEGANFLEQGENCHYRDSTTCGPHARMIIDRVNITSSAGNGANDFICRCGFRDGARTCILRGESIGVNPALVLHILSLIILTTFLVEIVLKLVAFRFKYFTHKFEVFDGAIVVISWILDVSSVIKEEAFEAAALLIVLRLWRVIRIVNGAILSSKSQSDKDLEDRRNEARKIVHAFHKAQDKMDDFEAQNFELKQKIRHLEKEKKALN